MTLFGGLIAFWLAVVGGYFVGEEAGAVVNNRGEVLYSTALAASQLLSVEVEERSLEIDLLARSLILVSDRLGDPKILQMLQLRKEAHNEYLWMGIGDVTGRVIQATDGILLGEIVSARPWFKAGLAGAYAGDVHEAVLLAKHLPQQKTNQPLRFIDFASPVYDRNGTVLGVLGAHASWDWVSDVVMKKIRDPQPDQKLEIFVVNSNGDILYPFEKIGTTRLPDGHQQYTHFELSDWGKDGQYLMSVVPVKSAVQSKLDWKIVVRQPASLAFEPVRHLRYKLIALGLVAGLLMVAGAFYFAKKLCKPIEALADVAKQVLRRDRKVAFPDPKGAGSAELAQLYTTFHAMTESLLDRERELSELNASLEHQVDVRTNELKLANLKLAELATEDPLTGLANRRCFEERLSAVFLQMKRTTHAYSILMVDVDFFKKVNDIFGHQAGDKVLQKLAILLSQALRSTDLVARYGGEEFIVLLAPVTSAEQGFIVADKIREIVAEAEFPSVGNISISVGLSAASTNDATKEDAVRRADSALYMAKEGGRNCVIVG
ncbi:MAG: diguanylate cyclase [Herbaspirillum huttiense]|uniref:sensor domain-containing diguanylate cyclase n=1 Tax=Herbaspirillum huttiense TaxID=863372 RepID=UPI001AC7C21E|nr:diguanylate cyclase [Herbaspirillum huttiense]MBN9357393.1 diguanylate cyclase [Herbaspirillum huttiense]